MLVQHDRPQTKHLPVVNRGGDLSRLQRKFRQIGQGTTDGAGEALFCNRVGAETCVLFTRRVSRKRRQSNARWCRALHICASLISGGRARPFGRTKLPNNSLPLLATSQSERRITKSQASVNRQHEQSARSSLQFSNDRNLPSESTDPIGQRAARFITERQSAELSSGGLRPGSSLAVQDCRRAHQFQISEAA